MMSFVCLMDIHYHLKVWGQPLSGSVEGKGFPKIYHNGLPQTYEAN